MDALPEKKLIPMALEQEGAVCAIGSVGRARGVDMSKIDPEDYDKVAATFGIATPLAQEIVYMNDEAFIWSQDENGHVVKDENGKWRKITPEERFAAMRRWVVKNLRSAEPAREPQP